MSNNNMDSDGWIVFLIILLIAGCTVGYLFSENKCLQMQPKIAPQPVKIVPEKEKPKSKSKDEHKHKSSQKSKKKHKPKEKSKPPLPPRTVIQVSPPPAWANAPPPEPAKVPAKPPHEDEEGFATSFQEKEPAQ